MPADSQQGEETAAVQPTPQHEQQSPVESPRLGESSATGSGSHTPTETGGSRDESTTHRALTPTGQSTSASSSSSASPNQHTQVEGRPSPPPGLSPQHADAIKQQQFTYNGRQMQVLPTVQAQMQAAVAQQQHQMMLAAQMHQMHLAQMQQQMQMQAAQQQQAQAARQTRGERRQPNPRGVYAGPNPGHFFAQQNAQQAAAQAAQMMSYEMYQQMLFSSGTVDAATLAAGIASGQLYQMYATHMASIAAPFFAAHAPPPHMHAHQPDAYTLHMQQQQHQHQQAFYNGQQEAQQQPQQPQPHQLTPQQQAQLAQAQAQAQAQQQLQQQQQQQQHQQQQQQPPQPHFRPSPKQHTPTPLLPSPSVYTGAEGAYSPAHSQNQQPMSYPPLSHSPPPPHEQMAQSVPLPQHSPSAGRHFRESSHHAAAHPMHHLPSDRHHGHSHRAHHRQHSNAEGGSPYEKSTPQPNTFKTEICRSYQASGSCEYGSSCQFSHGAHELRSREVDSKFKSELCKNFHAPANMQRTGPDGSILPLTPPAHVPHGAQPAVAPGGTGGSCWYGNRCRFLHDEFRIRHSAGEFWLVAPSDRLIRVERVDESNTTRIEQLMELVQSDHNKRQTMLYANSIPGATNANPATGTVGTVLNMPFWTQHMAMQMQHQLASQGEAQIHVREERSGAAARKEEREREREREGKEHFRHNSHGQHHHAVMQHAPAIGGDSAVHDALLASAVAARILPRSVVAITPIMPLSHAVAPNSAQITPSNSPPPTMQTQTQQPATVPTPVTVAPQPQQQQPAARSYASKVSAAPVAAAPAPVAAPAAAAPAPLVKPAAVRVQAVPMSVAPPVVSNAPAVWQTKVGRRGHKGRSTTTDSESSSPDGKRPHSDDAHESADVDGKQSSTSQADSDDADLSHIISKISELESESKAANMERKEKEQARVAHNMD